MLGMPGQYKSVALLLAYKIDFSFCANKDSFCRDSHIITLIYFPVKPYIKGFYCIISYIVIPQAITYLLYSKVLKLT